MYERFFRNFDLKVALNENEKEEIVPFLNLKRVRKNQYLLQQGDRCKFIAFVQKGALRQYSIDSDANLHTVQFAVEDWTISDLYSFLTGESSTYNIQAVEDTEVVLIEKVSYEELLVLVPKYETYIRLLLAGAYVAMQRRINSSISLSPEERYIEFIQQNAVISERFPQHMIASYLGLQPETLSRIRKKRA